LTNCTRVCKRARLARLECNRPRSGYHPERLPERVAFASGLASAWWAATQSA
jgi:hypothetical protein